MFPSIEFLFLINLMKCVDMKKIGTAFGEKWCFNSSQFYYHSKLIIETFLKYRIMMEFSVIPFLN